MTYKSEPHVHIKQKRKIVKMEISQHDFDDIQNFEPVRKRQKIFDSYNPNMRLDKNIFEIKINQTKKDIPE